MKAHVAMVELVWSQINKFFILFGVLRYSYTDFVLDEALVLLNALSENVMTFLKLLGHIVIFSVLIERFSQNLKRFL